MEAKKGVGTMETKEIIFELRTKKGLSQDELAEKVFVTRQAVSRWENGETVPNTETLKLLSKLFDVSINTLLGSPRELYCADRRWQGRQGKKRLLKRKILRVVLRRRRFYYGFLEAVRHYRRKGKV